MIRKWNGRGGRYEKEEPQNYLGNHMMVSDTKELLVRENPGYEITFRCE